MKKTVIIFGTFLLNMSFVEAQEVLYQGKFDNYSWRTDLEGDWKIIKQDGKHWLTFEENFDADKAPDLKIFLYKKPYKEITGKTAADKNNAALVTELKHYKGAYRHEIPAGINLSDYKAIIIHCEEYSKLWGGSDLE